MTPLDGLFIITAYAVGCDVKPHSLTAAGTRPVAGFTVAADPTVLPIGSIVYIEDLGERMVHDTGGLVKGRHIDVFVDSCHEAWRINAGRGTDYRHVRVLHVPKRRVRRAVNPVVVRR